MELAWRVCAAVKSNAIVLAAGGMAVGIGGGQQNRVTPGEIATARAAGPGQGRGGGQRRLLPVPGRPRRGGRRRGGRGHPARGLGPRRRGHRRGRRARTGHGVHGRKAVPALTRRSLMPGAPGGRRRLRRRDRSGGQAGRRPGGRSGLATILVGDDPASAGYVAKKHETCERCGLASIDVRISADGTPGRPARRRRPAQRRPGRRRLSSIQHPVPARLRLQRGHARPWTRPRTPTGSTRPTSGLLALGRPDGAPALHPARDPGHARSTTRSRSPGRNVVIVGRGPTLGRPLSMLLVPQGAGRQRGGDRRPHRRAGLGRLHPAADIVVGRGRGAVA